METFKFLGIEDFGETCCPHCGADGRYIYSYSIDGVVYGAMAGCYKRETAKYQKTDKVKYMETLADKQVKSKPLTGWDKNIIRLQGYLAEGKYDASWVERKIDEVLEHRRQYFLKK